MKLTWKKVTKLNPCREAVEKYYGKFPEESYNLKEVIEKIEEIGDKVWLLTHLMSPLQRLALAVFIADLLLPTVEREYPANVDPRMALTAAKVYLRRQSEKNKVRASNGAKKVLSLCLDNLASYSVPAFFACYAITFAFSSYGDVDCAYNTVMLAIRSGIKDMALDKGVSILNGGKT